MREREQGEVLFKDWAGVTAESKKGAA